MVKEILQSLAILFLICSSTISENSSAILMSANSASCASYKLKEANGSSEMTGYCDYPRLYSTQTGKCDPFNSVDCGNRPEPTTPCEYPNLNCTRPQGENISLCTCEKDPDLNYDMCSSLEDGAHLWPARHWSPFYIQCTSHRTIPTQCYGPSAMYNFFQDRCQMVYEVVNAAYSLSLSLDIPESLHHLIAPRPTQFTHKPTPEITITEPPATTKTEIHSTPVVSKTVIKSSLNTKSPSPLPSSAYYSGESFETSDVLSYTSQQLSDSSLFAAATSESVISSFIPEISTKPFVSPRTENSYSYQPESSLVFTPLSASMPDSFDSSNEHSFYTTIETAIETSMITSSQIKGFATENTNTAGNPSHFSVAGKTSFMTEITKIAPTPSSAVSTWDKSVYLESSFSTGSSAATLEASSLYQSLQNLYSVNSQTELIESFASYESSDVLFSNPIETVLKMSSNTEVFSNSVKSVKTTLMFSLPVSSSGSPLSTNTESKISRVSSSMSSSETLSLSASLLSSFMSIISTPPIPYPSFSFQALPSLSQSASSLPFTTSSVKILTSVPSTLRISTLSSSSLSFPTLLPSSTFSSEHSKHVPFVDSISVKSSQRDTFLLSSLSATHVTRDYQISEIKKTTTPMAKSSDNQISQVVDTSSDGVSSKVIDQSSSTASFSVSDTPNKSGHYSSGYQLSQVAGKGVMSTSEISTTSSIISTVIFPSSSSLLSPISLTLSSTRNSSSSVPSASPSSSQQLSSTSSFSSFSLESSSKLSSSSTSSSLLSASSLSSSSFISSSSRYSVILSTSTNSFSSVSMFPLSPSFSSPSVFSNDLSSSQIFISSTSSAIRKTSIVSNSTATKSAAIASTNASTTSKSSMRHASPMLQSYHEQISSANMYESISSSVSGPFDLSTTKSVTGYQPISNTETDTLSQSSPSYILPSYTEHLTVSYVSDIPTETVALTATKWKVEMISSSAEMSTFIKPSQAVGGGSSISKSDIHFSGGISTTTVQNKVPPSTKSGGKSSSELKKNNITSIAVGVGVGGGILIIIVVFVIVIVKLRKRKKRGRKDFFQLRLPPELFMTRSL